jgi:CRP-like cAMP-binding protein
MYHNDADLEASKQFSDWQAIIDWAKNHFRDRVFTKDERIPTRSGLLYLVEKGVVRTVSKRRLLTPIVDEELGETSEPITDMFLGFIGEGQVFEIVDYFAFHLEVYAQVEDTRIIWLYWHDIDNWLYFRRELLDFLRYKHKRQLVWMTALGQRSTIDRLLGFLILTIEECGLPHELGYYLPYNLTHAQISSAIGSTRVTVTRLMGKLRKNGSIVVLEDNLICLPRDRKSRV